MKTVTIQIGNSDNKLSQKEWSSFVACVYDLLRLSAWEIHFAGTSNPTAPWQNACWVFDIDEEDFFGLKQELRSIAHQYNQDSIAWTVGETEFI